MYLLTHLFEIDEEVVLNFLCRKLVPDTKNKFFGDLGLALYFLSAMNRLILVGNGFDLAHGLKTSYADFLLNYLKTSFTTAWLSRSFEDDIMFVKGGAWYDASKVENWKLEDFLQCIILEKPLHIPENFGFYQSNPPFLCSIKSKFIENLILNCHSCGWVDIELEYYQALKEIIFHDDIFDAKADVNELNKVFNSLKIRLENYLHSIVAEDILTAYEEIFKNNMPIHNYSTLFVNFNYTPLLNPFLIRNPQFGINYIHGQLKNKDNRMIFGYGDDLDEAYKEIEKQRGTEYLRFAKSFGYILTDNYRTLNSYLNRYPYEVYVMGLSCGLTDRTMLNMIFEHINCVNIRVFYHQAQETDNFLEISQQISRHFRDKQLFRTRMIPFDSSTSMPQRAL
jgi:hypothetical protein